MAQYTLPATGQLVDTNSGAATDATQRLITASNSPEVVSVASLDTKTPSQVAHGTADAGSPAKIGGVARTAWQAAVAGASRVNASYDKYGRMLIANNPRDLRSAQHTVITSSVAETTIISAGAAGVFNDVSALIISNTSVTACNVTVKDATAGTNRFVIAVPAGGTVQVVVPSSDAHKQAAAAANWTATCSASVASISVTAMFVANVDA